MGKLIIDGNSVYEIDEECMKKRKVSQTCEIEQALKKQAERICLADASAATTATAAVSA